MVGYREGVDHVSASVDQFMRREGRPHGWARASATAGSPSVAGAVVSRMPLYSYVNGQPLTIVDPMGAALASIWPGIGRSALCGALYGISLCLAGVGAAAAACAMAALTVTLACVAACAPCGPTCGAAGSATWQGCVAALASAKLAALIACIVSAVGNAAHGAIGSGLIDALLKQFGI